ncbi:MAG: DUF262 domain-containing HNH endonuclease family protein [Chloroflexota bacterium]|nr:DUF262 domain-containing HNH endonuclease family protein [Chloroflexota bacterium]
MPRTEGLIGFEQVGIGSLLRQNLLRVPPNQREYAWTEREVGQLFTDIARAVGENTDYFLGTIVTIPRPNGLLEVVDGQQRLATTAILLSAIRRYMKEVGGDLLEQAIYGDFLTGIDRTRRARVPRMTLNSSDHELFRTIVTFEGGDELPSPSLESHELLIAAYEQAYAHVRRIVAPFDARDHGDRLNAWVTFLESKAHVVLLKVPDDSDAYRMFETLNDRGLRTTQADLIKNYLFGRAGERIDEVQSRWAFMRGTLETIDEDDLTVTFLRHALIVQHGHIRQADVYDVVQDTVRSEDTTVTFAADLERLAVTYAATFNPEHESWNAHSASTRQAIRVLQTFNIRPLRPTVLAVAARIRAQAEVAEALRFLLSLGVRLMIASSTRSGAVETPLANVAHAIWDGTILTAAALKKALSQITPSDEEFRLAFESARVSNVSLARYYLRSLETAAKNEAEPWFMPTDDGTVINLEHVLPKRPQGNWPQFNDDEVRLYGRRIGNLALMRATDNSTIRSAPFPDKLPLYAQSPYVLTSDIANHRQWTVKAIAQRQTQLAQLALQAWPIS